MSDGGKAVKKAGSSRSNIMKEISEVDGGKAAKKDGSSSSTVVKEILEAGTSIFFST